MNEISVMKNNNNKPINLALIMTKFYLSMVY